MSHSTAPPPLTIFHFHFHNPFSQPQVGFLTMTQFEISVATQASQSGLLPVILIASLINQACP
jgi:hypothetical protein